MRMRNQRTRYGRSAWLKAFCALCCLVISLGTLSAAQVQEQSNDALTLSPAPAKTSTVASAVLNPDAPDVAGCPITVLPNNGGTSGNERAPNSNFRFGRAVWLITAAEAAANGLTSGMSPSAIGFNYSAAGIAASGTLVVYMQNTADVTNTKSTTWATAITGMTTVSNSAQSLPAAAGPFDLQFSGGSPFTYTGGGLYIAFDWSWAGPAGTTAVVLCNTALVGGLKGANGATSAPLTVAASDFRPETRLTPSVATVINDGAVDFVMAYGARPVSLVGGEAVRAVVSNRGINVLNNLPVTLNITGANAFSNGQVVPTLAACSGTALVTFAPFTPTATGADTFTVSVPADDQNGNNSKNRPVDESNNSYSYKHPGTTASGGVGLTGASGIFVGKFNITQAAKVSEIKLEFFATSATTYKAAIYGDSGSGTPSLAAPLYLDAANRTVTVAGPVTITLASPVSVGPGNFYVGIQQTNTTNASLSFDNEVPIRTGAFYLATAIPPAAWIDFAPGNNFKLNIGATLIQCTTVAECNDNNACTDDACTNNICTHVNNSLTECDGNSCSSPDTCSNGVCTPGPNPCTDGDACTQDLCDGQGGCLHPATDCNDNNPCTDDFCVPATGCGHTNNTGACSDGNPCTIGDSCSGGACIPGSGALPAPVQACNNGVITIPSVGAASPYPATINVSGQRSYLCKVTVDINGITHTFPDDIDILLAKGAANAIIMSDVGGGTDVVGVNLTLSDAAATSLPDSTVLTSGTFKPTNIGGGDVFPAPAPSPAGGSALSAFTGANPNGAWDLWVDDQFTPDGGTINAWCVNIVSVCTNNADCNDNNVCTDDACVNSVCVYTNNTVSCTDNNACTAGDTCTNGICVGGPPPPCDDGDACTANQCNPGTGLCENPPIVCNDNNACTDDSCNSATGCVYTNNNSNVCSDNNLCTTPDVCVNGACVGQNPVVCTPDANTCTTEQCNPGTGLCVSVNNTNPCDDGDVCTSGDTCGPNLVQIFGEDFDNVTPPALPAGWSSSQTGAGQPWVTGAAVSDTAPNSAVAFEGTAVADEVLVSPSIAIATASAQLTFANRWSYEASPPSFYDGGVLEISIGGGGFVDIVTAGGSFVSGGYTGVISTGFSSPLAGRNAWSSASAGYPAFLTTTVNLPAAAAGQNIQLRWRSASDSSVGGSGQEIDSIVISEFGANVCQPGTPISCDDSNLCTDDFCAAGQGCQHANNNENCDDNNACTILDACAAGSCGGTLIVCNDANPCTSDSCDPGSGCIFAPNPAPGESSGVGAPNKTTYTWAATAGATGYDVVRGSTAAFPVGPGGGDETCLGPVASPSVTDAGVPAVGSGYFYIIRAKNACGNGPYGNEGFHGAPASPRTTTTCP
jgi:hypothetical protein